MATDEPPPRADSPPEETRSGSAPLDASARPAGSHSLTPYVEGSGGLPTATMPPGARLPGAEALIGNTPDTLYLSSTEQPRLELLKYTPEKQQDYVRLIVTVGLLLMFAWVIVWASIQSASSKDHWEQTKDMLQIILPALTGLIGSVLGFYFGSRGSKTN